MRRPCSKFVTDMSTPAYRLDEHKPPVANLPAQRWPEAIVALLILGFFLRFCWHALYVRFALDEMMNMYRHWEPGIWKTGWAGLTFSNSVIRPMGALYYMPLFKI